MAHIRDKFRAKLEEKCSKFYENVNSGETKVEDVLCPKGKPGHILVETRKSLISADTERMLVNCASKLKVRFGNDE